jgi:hypothetical protein
MLKILSLKYGIFSVCSNKFACSQLFEAFRVSVVFYLKNNHGKLLKKKCNDVFLMGPPHRMDYCKLVHIRGEIGLDLKAFADVSKFLIENNKSVKSGFAKLAGKSSKDTIKMIGDNLYEYLLNNSG